MLIAQGILPPEVEPPDLNDDPISIYNSWLNSLPPPLRSAVLSMVPECNIQKQFMRVSGDDLGQRDSGKPALHHRVQLSLIPERNMIHNPGDSGNATHRRPSVDCRGGVLSDLLSSWTQEFLEKWREHFTLLYLQIEDSPRFLFLIFTEVISLLPGSAFWTVLFFLALLGLGLCTNLMYMLGNILTLQDTFPFCRRQPRLLTGTPASGVSSSPRHYHQP